MSKRLIVIIVAFVLIGTGVLFGKDFFRGKTAAKAELLIKSNPTSSIFLDAQNLGRTPYEEKLIPGEYELKLIPEDGNSLSSWQQRIKLEAGTQTYVNVELGTSEVTSGWEILSLEKIKKGEIEIALFSKTDGGEAFLDGERKGTTPLSLPKIPKGTHELKLSAPGFRERLIKINITPGYKLIINSQLALLEDKTEEKEMVEKTPEEEKEMVKPYILIKETSTGWLRVREEPKINSQELTKVNPGEKYPLLEEESGWYKIEYEKGKEGWISGRYAEKVE